MAGPRGPLTIEGSGGVAPPSLLSPLAGPGEVETEFEDEGEDYDEEEGREQQPLEEVEEEFSEGDDGGAEGSVASAAAGKAAGDGNYAVPEVNKEVWKNFGCDTEAGRALRKLYAGIDTSRGAASKVSYPSLRAPAERWQPKAKERKPCPQRAPVRVPAQRPKPLDRDDPKNWPKHFVPCRKPGDQILAEMEAAKPQVPNLVPGRNQAAEKRNLAERFQFCGGRMMPKGAMGNVEASEDLPEHVGPTMREMAEARHDTDENGMTSEHRGIFQELMLAVQRKQARIKEIDGQNAAEPAPSKARTDRNKEALQLRNDIDRCLKDIDKLMDITAT